MKMEMFVKTLTVEPVGILAFAALIKIKGHNVNAFQVIHY